MNPELKRLNQTIVAIAGGPAAQATRELERILGFGTLAISRQLQTGSLMQLARTLGAIPTSAQARAMGIPDAAMLQRMTLSHVANLTNAVGLAGRAELRRLCQQHPISAGLADTLTANRRAQDAIESSIAALRSSLVTMPRVTAPPPRRQEMTAADRERIAQRTAAILQAEHDRRQAEFAATEQAKPRIGFRLRK